MKSNSTHLYPLLIFLFSIVVSRYASAQSGGCFDFTDLPPGNVSSFLFNAEYGNPVVITPGCNEMNSVRLTADLTFPFNSTGDGLQYSTYIGINPQPTLLAGFTYTISFNAAIDIFSFNSFDQVYLNVRAVNSGQSSYNCSGSCVEMQAVNLTSTACQQFSFTFTPNQDYNRIVFAAIGTSLDTAETLLVALDNFCITETAPCEPEFTWVSDPCGNVQFFNNSDPLPTSSNWHFTGPGLPSGGVDVEDDNPVFSFPASGTYTVTLTVNCTGGGTGTVTQTVTVMSDQIPPVIQNCPTFSPDITLHPPNCNYQYTIPAITATDNNGGVSMFCTWNNVPVNPNQTVTLPPGIHDFICVAEDNCGNTAICNFQVAVQCDTTPAIPAPCDGYDDGSIDNWNVHNTYPNGASSFGNANVVVGSPGITGNSNDYYLQFKDVSGSTWALNDVDFNGNWNNFLGSCLCFDYKVKDDGDPGVIPVTPAIYLTGPINPNQAFAYGINPVIMAGFTINTTITELDGWQSYCAPIELCDSGGNLPSNVMGSWSMLAGSGCTDWATLLSNVGGVMFRLDFTSRPSEIVQVDNICVKECCTAPPCDPGNLCDSIMVMVDSIPPTLPGDQCCYSIDLKIPDGLAYACFDMVTPGVIFNTAMLTTAGFQLDTLANGTKICIRDNAPGRPHLTGGMYNDLLKLCLANVSNASQNPQCVAVTFWQLNAVDIPVLVCSDTLKFHCAPPVSSADTCLAFEVLEVQCDPDNPNKYQLTFGICNNSGFTASQVVLTSQDPDIKFLPCALNFVPQPSIGVPLVPALASGNCDNTLCVDIVSSIPITSAYTFCMALTIWNSTMCCTSPEAACVTLAPCCNPCDENGVVSNETTGATGPKTVFFPPVKDGTLTLSQISFGDGTGPDLQSGHINVGSEVIGRSTFVDFDFLDQLCQGATIQHAELKLFANTSGSGHNDAVQSNACWQLGRVTTPWTEGTLLADNPQSSPVDVVPVNAPNFPYEHYTIDVTQLVIDMVNDPTNSHGFELYTICGHDHMLDFASRENPDGTLHPVLEILYDDTQCDSIPTGNCCHSLDLVNDCEIDFFTKVELLSATPGVNIGSHFTGGPNPMDWTVTKSTYNCVQWEHASGFIPTGTIPGLINFCLSDIDPNETPQIMYLNWYTTNSAGETVIACTDTLTYTCPADDNGCISFLDVTLDSDPCDTSATGLNYSVTLQNNSSPPHFATSLMMNCVTPGVSVFPNNILFPGPGLPYLGITTANFNISGAYSPGDIIKIEMRLHDSASGDDWCCFESDTLCIVIPECIDSCCSLTATAFDSLFNAGLVYTVDHCEICFPFALDSCDVLTIDYGNGTNSTYQNGNTICQTYASPGGVFAVHFDWKRYNKLGEICLEKDTTVEIVVECPPPPCCTDYPHFQSLANLGWTITYGDSCRVTVTAPQFDTCHFISHSEPDWGDGTPSLTIFAPANGSWTHQYAQSGNYNICAHIYEGSFADGFCWDTIMCSPVIIECPPPPCCTDYPHFQSLANLGWTITYGDSCRVTVTAPQFDTCHFISHSEPDWGDGTPSLTIFAPANGSWTHQYAQSGNYNICAIIYEGSLADGFCWDTTMCSPVTVECPPPPCCTDYPHFQSLANLGWTITYGDSCKVTVTAPQFDTCHFISHSEPDWGDGTPSLTIFAPANGSWTHQYAQSSNYNICAHVYEGSFADGFCWDTTMCSPVTVECPPPSSCCTDYPHFQSLINMGWTITYGDSCRVTVTAPQFDTCHFISHSEPDWGDGSSSLTIFVPANGSWTHQYAQSGNYNICAHVYEGSFADGFCWDTIMCSPVTVNCCTISPCDAVDISSAPDPTSMDTCCYIVTVDNNYCDSTYFKGLLIQTTLPTTISQITVLNGWVINQFNATTAAVIPAGGGYISQGVQDVFRICTDNYTTNPHFVTVSWLIPVTGGGVDTICSEQLIFDCAVPPADVSCVQIVDDSINCLTNTYCFRIKNNSTPGFNINQVQLINLLPATAALTPNPAPIPLLAPGQTSGWICMSYTGLVAGDNLCYNTIAHFVDANGNALTCCTDTVGHCVTVPACGGSCCDITQTGFDSLLQNTVLQPVSPGNCEICLNYAVDTCDVLQMTFGDGGFAAFNGGTGVQCHTYATSGTYTITIKLIRYDDTGDTCRFAQTQFPVTVSCTPPPDCCDITQAGFDSLLQNIVLQPINPADCEVCLNYAVDSCDVLQLAFGDGSIVTQSSGNGVQCHTYPVSGTYTIIISLIRYDDTGDTCRFAQTQFPVTVNCPIPPDCCDISQAGFDSLLQNIILQPINPASCEVCMNYAVDSCDVLQLAFGDGSIVTQSGGSGVQCHTYPVSGTYTIIISLIRYDDTGDTCRFAQTQFPVTVTCPAPSSCCDITQSGFDSLLQNIVLQPVNPASCEVCLDYAVDTCDVLHLSFGDGSTASFSGGGGLQCHTYAVSGNYTITVSLIRFDDTGDTCRFAQTQFSVTVNCDLQPVNCCDISAGAFDTLFRNGLVYSIDQCQLCWPYQLDSCDVLAVNYGNGTTFTYGAGDTLCYGYNAPGGTFPVTVTFTRYDSTGNICHQRDTTFNVQVNCVITNCDAASIKIYNAMSPDDGDNLNEVLLIENYEDCGRIDISVYNRWGQLVFQQADYDNTWKGISQEGKQLPDGTYYLLLELPDVDERTQSLRIQTFIDIRRD